MEPNDSKNHVSCVFFPHLQHLGSQPLEQACHIRRQERGLTCAHNSCEISSECHILFLPCYFLSVDMSARYSCPSLGSCSFYDSHHWVQSLTNHSGVPAEPKLNHVSYKYSVNAPPPALILYLPRWTPSQCCLNLNVLKNS